MSSLNPYPTPAPSLGQLPLPWADPTFLPPLPPPSPAPLTIRPQDLWASLSPTLQRQVRQTILHVLQEVLYDHAQP